MISIFWFEQTEADIPSHDNWLSPCEAHQLDGLRFPKRRFDWRLGRWTAKCAVARCLDAPERTLSPAEIEIRVASSGAPGVFVGPNPAPAFISLSHSFGRAVCAVAGTPVALGCDVERIETRSHAFIADYLTAEEQDLFVRANVIDHPWLATLLWSAKESALKALHEGLRLDTRSVIVNPRELSSVSAHWHPLQVRSSRQVFDGWWQYNDNFIRTMVCNLPPAPPISLNGPRAATQIA